MNLFGMNDYSQNVIVRNVNAQAHTNTHTCTHTCTHTHIGLHPYHILVFTTLEGNKTTYNSKQHCTCMCKIIIKTYQGKKRKRNFKMDKSNNLYRTMLNKI
jgi:hypothetical protein